MPARQDELELYTRLRIAAAAANSSGWGGRAACMEIVRELGMPEKRAFRLLEKWYVKGWIECGMWVWGGWFTAQAPETLSP